MKFVSPGQLDTGNMGTWPIYYKVILWVAIVGIGAFVYNKFAREPLVEQQSANQTEIEGLEAKYKQLYQYTQDLPKYQERSAELVEILKSLLEFLPSEEEMPNLIDSVYAAGIDNNIIFNLFQPKLDVKRGFYDVKPIDLDADTKYANYSHFTGRISALQRILNVSDMSIKIDEKDPSKLSIKSQLQTYVYNQNLDEFLKQDVNQLKNIGGENANGQ